MDPVPAAADLDQLVLRLDVERPEGRTCHALVGTDRFRNDPDRGVSATRPWRGRLCRPGRETEQPPTTRPGSKPWPDDPVRRVATTTGGLFLARAFGRPRDVLRGRSDRPSPVTRQRRSGSSLAGRPGLPGRDHGQSRTLQVAGLQAQEGDDVKAGELREFAGKTTCCCASTSMVTSSVAVTNFPAVEDPAQGGVAVEVRLRLDTGTRGRADVDRVGASRLQGAALQV